MFATFDKLDSNGRPTKGEVRIVPGQVATLEDGPHFEFFKAHETVQERCTSTKITLKDKREFIVHGDQIATSVKLRRVR